MATNRFIPLISTVPGAVPTASALYQGEVAINVADGLIFTRSGSSILVLNEFDKSNLISSSQQVLDIINNSTITPYLVSSSAFAGSFTGSIETSQIKVTAGGFNLHISTSVATGIFGETRLIDPPMSNTQFAGASIDYTAQRPNNLRAGTIISSWSGSSIAYTDISSTDVGNTEDLSFNLISIGNDVRLRAYSAGSGSGAWSIQFLFKLFPNLL